ncbi:MAG: hypothetical protein HYV95_09275 [Opitutae bacterium]|nr:hypothetical protein [Opitutae bacterium]
MGNPNQDTQSAAGTAALALAEASAAAGTAAAQLGYQLTTQALKESSAVAVFPLLLLELTAIAEGFAAYAATDAAAKLATATAQAAVARGTAYWA